MSPVVLIIISLLIMVCIGWVLLVQEGGRKLNLLDLSRLLVLLRRLELELLRRLELLWRLELLILVGGQEENLHRPGFVGREAALGNKMILGGWTYPAGLVAPDACVRRTVWS